MVETADDALIRARDPADHVLVVSEGAPGSESIAKIPIADFATTALVDNRNPGLAAKPESGPSRYYLFEDYIGGTITNILQVASGTGSGTAFRTDAPDTGLGWLNYSTGTTATGRVSQATPATLVQIGVGLSRHQSRIRMLTLSTVTETYTLRSGLLDNAAGEAVDGCFFRYTNGVNGGRFQAVCRSNNVETAADTGITPAANTTYILDVRVNAAATSAEFFIDGASVATITTNIPTGTARLTGAGVQINKNVGTTSITAFCVDYQLIEQQFTGAR